MHNTNSLIGFSNFTIKLFGLKVVMAKHLFAILLIFFTTIPCLAKTLNLDEQFDYQQDSGIVFTSKPTALRTATIDLQLELFSPSGNNLPIQKPALILIHGGGFTGGNRFNNRLIQLCKEMAKRGWVCVSIDYRLMGDQPILDPIITETQWWSSLHVMTEQEFTKATAIAAATEDSLAAYQWLIANAEILGFDPTRIAIGGSSAGAATSLLVGYFLDDLQILNKGDISAVIDMWGSLQVEKTYIQADDPALFITHGSDDTVVPTTKAYELSDHAVSIQLPYQMYSVSNAGHGYDLNTAIDSSGETIFLRILDFLYQHVILREDSNLVAPTLGISSIALLAISLIYIQVIRRQPPNKLN